MVQSTVADKVRKKALRRIAKGRRGAVAVEFALTASLLFFIIFTAIEFMRVNSIVNSTENAAYEGARAAIVPGAVDQNAKDAANAMIKAIGVRGATVDVQPAPITDNTAEITVTVSVPLDKNSFIAPRFFLGDTLTIRLSRAAEANRPATCRSRFSAI
jgi:Flp pilus assembly protein TadG